MVVVYPVNKSNGALAVDVTQGTIDNTFNIKLIGRGVSNFGELMAENLLHMVENFAADVPPGQNGFTFGSPTIGQLWYDTSSKKLKVYDTNTNPVWTELTSSTNLPVIDNMTGGWQLDISDYPLTINRFGITAARFAKQIDTVIYYDLIIPQTINNQLPLKIKTKWTVQTPYPGQTIELGFDYKKNNNNYDFNSIQFDTSMATDNAGIQDVEWSIPAGSVVSGDLVSIVIGRYAEPTGLGTGSDTYIGDGSVGVAGVDFLGSILYQ